MKIKTNDTVKIITGKDKGASGKVLKAYPRENKIVVEGVNMKKKHERAKQQGKKGQVVDIAYPIDASNAKKE